MLTTQEVLGTLDETNLWDINFKALRSELEKRYRVSERDATNAIQQAASDGAIVIDDLGQVRRPDYARRAAS